MARTGRPRHAPTPESRRLVQLAAAVGTPHHDIATLIGTGTRQLLRDYPEELKLGKIRANVKIGGKLYEMAAAGNLGAIVWWDKRNGFREKQIVEHSGLDGKPIAQAMATTVTDEDGMKAYLKMVTGE